jgi:phosphatidylglycerol:prolipoprotein diacylglycerol transferase
MPAPFIHDFSPFALGPIHYGNSEFGVRWYGLAYLLGLMASWWLLRRWARQGRLPVDPKIISDAVFIIGMWMIVGGRLGYCAFYYTQFAPDGSVLYAPPVAWLYDPLYVFRLWEGGMASHGGIVGLFAGGLWWCWRHRVRFPVFADAGAVTAPLGVMAGRAANFINGELYGRVAPRDFGFGWIFPDGIPTELRTLPHTPEWQATVRAVGEVRHPYQLYAVVLEGLLPFLAGLLVHLRHRRPGLSCGTVIATYGVGRFIGEFWREPDAGYALFLGWMSKGQLYSLPFVAAGLGMAAWALWRGPRPADYRAVPVPVPVPVPPVRDTPPPPAAPPAARHD